MHNLLNVSGQYLGAIIITHKQKEEKYHHIVHEKDHVNTISLFKVRNCRGGGGGNVFARSFISQERRCIYLELRLKDKVLERGEKYNVKQFSLIFLHLLLTFFLIFFLNCED